MIERIHRGKRRDNREWVSGYVARYYNSIRICPGDIDIHNNYDVDPETVCEFTGLFDRDDTGIFEKDIVEHPDYPGRYKVFWDAFSGRWALKGIRTLDFKYRRYQEWKVIGNVIDNPNLL